MYIAPCRLTLCIIKERFSNLHGLKRIFNAKHRVHFSRVLRGRQRRRWLRVGRSSCTGAPDSALCVVYGNPPAGIPSCSLHKYPMSQKVNVELEVAAKCLIQNASKNLTRNVVPAGSSTSRGDTRSLRRSTHLHAINTTIKRSYMKSNYFMTAESSTYLYCRHSN